MGIDQWGWDLPFHAQIAKSKADNDNTIFWEAHRVGQRRPYWHMEQLANLGALPPQRLRGRRASRCASSAPPPPPPASWR